MRRTAHGATRARRLAWNERRPDWQAPRPKRFAALGDYRDRKTSPRRCRRSLAAVGLADSQRCRATAGEPRSIRSRSSASGFQYALLDLVAFLLAPPPPSGRQDGAASDADAPEQVVARRLDKLHDRLKRDAKHFEQLDDNARHGVRKRLKRLRYLSELVAPMYKRGRVRRFLGTLEPAQDKLGHYIDLLVATGLAHEVVDGGDARAWFNVGWLKAQLPRAAIERSGKCLRGIVDAEPFWR